MLGRLVLQSFWRGKRKKALAVASVAIGVGVASGLLGLVTHMGDLVAEDLRRFGSNIIVRPETRDVPLRYGGVTISAASRQLLESDLPKIKQNFWRHNILAFAPYLHAVVRDPKSGREFPLTGTWFDRRVEGTDFRTGVREAAPWWEIDGDWIDDRGDRKELIIGARLAAALGIDIGESLAVEREGWSGSFRCVGIVRTGGDEEDQAFTRLDAVQEILGDPEAVSQVMVSALTRAEPKGMKSRENMTPAERERFDCCPYPSNIARTIENRIAGSRVQPMAAVVRVEGDLLRKVEAVSLGMGAVALVGAILGVVAAMAQVIGARRGEIALMQVLGARRSQVLGQLALEGLILGLVGGAIGCIIGAVIVAAGASLFGIPMGIPFALLPLVLLISVSVVLLGTLPHAVRALRAWPVRTLRVEGL